MFQRNLRSLLLGRPVRGRPICAIDPGFRNGCKTAVIDATGAVVSTTTLYPHPPQKDAAGARCWLREALPKHGCTVVAVGNGTACRETEAFLAGLRADIPGLVYTVVNEAGASTYSTSSIAEVETSPLLLLLPPHARAHHPRLSLVRGAPQDDVLRGYIDVSFACGVCLSLSADHLRSRCPFAAE